MTDTADLIARLDAEATQCASEGLMDAAMLLHEAAQALAASAADAARWRYALNNRRTGGFAVCMDTGHQWRVWTPIKSTGNLDAAMAASQANPSAARAPEWQEVDVEDSSFEAWFYTLHPEDKGDKPRARDAYAAGMADRAALAAAAPAPAVQAVPGITNADIRREFLAAGFTIKPGHDDLKPYVYEAARRVLALAAAAPEPAAASVAPQAAPAPIHVEAVAEVVLTAEGNRLDWLVEGGIAAMEYGSVLVLASEPITDDDGSGEVYRAAPVAQPLTPAHMVSTIGAGLDALMDHVSEYGVIAEGSTRHAVTMARAVERACAEAWGVTLASTAAGQEGGAA